MMPKSPSSIAVVTPSWKRKLASRLLAWYHRHRRDLPWRNTADPYAIWVSEIMLQQTQVATVIPYFHRFLRAFPSVRALAKADERDVLRQWEGLGYYRRARQLHRAAQIVSEQHGGRVPEDFAAVRALPGIGRYTAGAIVSIAFDRPVPILEANTIRLFSRLVAFAGDTASSGGQRLLWQVAQDILPAQNCREFNQALMELGSLVCTPRSPDCPECPLVELCQARRRDLVDRIPQERPQPKFERVREAAVVVWHGERVLLHQRPAGQRWAGLWDFLRFPIASHGHDAIEQELLAAAKDRSGLTLRAPRRLTTLRHGVTRFRITLECYAALARSSQVRMPQDTWQWVAPSELERFPLSVTARKLARIVAGS